MSIFSVALVAFLAFFPITNPIGALATFASLSSSLDDKSRHTQGIKVGIYVFLILAVFAVSGNAVLQLFGLSIGALQIAGGIVVGHSGFAMLTAKQQLTSEEHAHAKTIEDISFTPMALPLVSGPGSIGVAVALASKHPGIEGTIGVVIGAAAIGLLVAILLRFGTSLVVKLGPTGVGAISRIMGFIILSIGVVLIIDGVKAVHLF